MGPPLYLSLHDVLRLTEGCNDGPVRLMYTNSTPTQLYRSASRSHGGGHEFESCGVHFGIPYR